MARRSSKASETPTPEAQEANVSNTETIEATPAETPAEVTTEATPEAVIDLTAFEAAVEAAVAERDTSTGDVPEAHFSTINQAYRALDGAKPKNKAKARIVELLTSAMNDMDAVKTRSYMVIQNNLSASGPKAAGTKAERVPVDPTEAYVEQLTTLNLARALVVAPEGVAEDANEKADALYGEQYSAAEALLAWTQSDAEDKGDEPDAPAFVKNAVKLALGRSAKAGGTKARTGTTSTFTGERRNVEKHIVEVFDSVESGAFLSVAEIRKHKTSEYGDDLPSAGAISARLFPKSGKVTLPESITPSEQDGKKGAVKA